MSAVRPEWSITTYPPKGVVQVGINKHGTVVQVENFTEWPDVLVMQRPGLPVLAGVAAFMQSRGVAVVVDMDDAMWRIDRANHAWAAWNNPNRHRGQHWSWCDQVTGHADLVTVTTPALADRYGRHGRCVVLPNRIPDRWVLTAPTLPPAGVAGWAGYTATHPGDCEVSAPAAQVFAEAGGLRVIGDGDGAAKAWGTPVQELPSQELGPDYYQAINQLGVMLVGLRDTPFNRAKSTLKVLEAAAAGIPSIAAATAPHRALMAEGFPVALAATPDEWAGHARWLTNASALEERAVCVREVMPRYTMGAQAEAWADAWERAANRAGSARWVS